MALDVRASEGLREFRTAEKCLWCALLYFSALVIPIAICRLLL